jgi:hypothetical protein
MVNFYQKMTLDWGILQDPEKSIWSHMGKLQFKCDMTLVRLLLNDNCYYLLCHIYVFKI